MNIQEAIIYLHRLTVRMRDTISVGGLTYIISAYLAVLKKGNMTQAFIEKVVEGVNDDLGIRLRNISVDVCQLLYKMFGRTITDTNVSEITTHWAGLLPNQASRLRLTVTQAAGSGLTALITTGVALRSYPNFKWARVQGLFPTEFEDYKTAVGAVGNNVWYGFKQDLGVVRSTRFKNLAYVAKELLIRIDGKGSLTQYRGWTRTPRYREVLDSLITEYEDYVKNMALGKTIWEEQTEERKEGDSITELIEQIKKHTAVYTM